MVISPVSLHLALALLQQGAGGRTRQQLASLLQLEAATECEVRLGTRRLLDTYRQQRRRLNTASTTIQLANVIFAEVEVKQDYRNTLQTYFSSGVRTLDFGRPQEAAATINSWVENKTSGLITDFLPASAIKQDTALMLINAIYFKANWRTSFDSRSTKQDTFHVDQNTRTIVNMMYQENYFTYLRHPSLNCQLVSLPYEDDTFSMMLLLPNQEGAQAVDTLIQNIADQDFNLLRDQMESTNLKLTMPKFKIGYKTKEHLKSSLQQNGLTNIFNDADLSRISNTPLEVSDILHETMVEVTEDGSEAAGVTGGLLQTKSGSFGVSMTLNRPFVFVIHDHGTNIPLFIGRIARPTEVDMDTRPTQADRREELNMVQVEAVERDTEEAEWSRDWAGLVWDGEKWRPSTDPVKLTHSDPEELTASTGLEWDGERWRPSSGTSDPAELTGSDPEELSHRRNHPGAGQQQQLCTGDEASHANTAKVLFPCPHRDTPPIETHKQRFGDPSGLGVNGEVAALRHSDNL